ncbi:MAG TPA: UbiA family prenyltransferase [Micromonosporaceae bacterium]
MRRILVGLVRACHPEPTAAVTVGAALLAVVVGRSPAGVAAVAVAVLASQLAVGWCNDALDAGRDALTGRADKPIPAGLVSRRTVAVGAVVAALATVPLSFLSGPRAAAALLLALVSGLLYDWPLKFTMLSVVPYLVSFGALVAFVPLGLPGAPAPPAWLVVAGALLGAGAHFANVLPDLDDDARTGVRGLPHRLGRTGSWVAATVLLASATGALAFGPPGPPSWAALLIVAGTVVALGVAGYAARTAGSRAAFRAVLLVAVADVTLLLLAGSRV